MQQVAQAPIDPALARALAAIRRPVAMVPAAPRGEPSLHLLRDDGGFDEPAPAPAAPVSAVLPALYPEWLGERRFAQSLGARFNYVVGDMAQGIASADMVVAAAQAGLVGFYGSAGQPLPVVERAIERIGQQLGPQVRHWGVNLIHSPQHPHGEMDFVALCLARGVGLLSASAFMSLSPAVVWFAASGLRRDGDGRVRRARTVAAKVSRAEVARPFLSPPPPAMLGELVAQGRLSATEAELARELPVAACITAEADSGGHTDNRPLVVLVPALMQLRDELSARMGQAEAPLVGAAGGLGTPAAVAAAFACGAAYVVTGSVNQCAVESGLSADAREMLAQAGPADVAMAPAADMFELGVKVQVLKRGTLFAQRAQRLWEAYREHPGLEALPPALRQDLERSVLGEPIEAIWAQTSAHFERADPAQIERAHRDPKHRMALVFRWYLFMAAQWAREGRRERRADYQVWCGPAMGAFNDWVRGSCLEPAGARSVRQIAYNLLEGAATLTRAHQLRTAGVALPAAAFAFTPRLFA